MLGQTDLVVVEYHGNYADEFDVDATKVMSYEEYLELKETMEKAFEYENRIEIYFGTNECVDIESTEGISFKFISNAEYLTLVKYGLIETGFTCVLGIESYEYAIERNEEE